MSTLSSDRRRVVSWGALCSQGWCTGPRAAIKVAAPLWGAAASIAWGLRPASLRPEGLQAGDVARAASKSRSQPAMETERRGAD